MQIQTVTAPITEVEADAVVVGVFQGASPMPAAAATVSAALDGQLDRVRDSGEFKGALGDTMILGAGAGLRSPRVILTGLGRPASFGAEPVRRAAAAATVAARKRNLQSIASAVHGIEGGHLPPDAAAQALVEGALLAGYTFRSYKSPPPADEVVRDLSSLVLVAPGADVVAAVRAGADAGQAIASGVNLARDLANHPSNTATPTYLAERAGELAERYSMRFEAWDRDRIASEGMGAFASVAKGSDESPRFIILEHAPTGKTGTTGTTGTAGTAPYVLVGKGLTFDAGGISLKPGLKMGVMKADMAGAAAVLGAMSTVAALDLPLRVVALVSATENLPGGHATKPGDIVRARNGTTIEVVNTDAEGRMVLADALCYAQGLKPAAVVDMATLTGAIVVALGHHAAGLFCNDEPLAAELQAAAESSGERVWRMPIWEEYADLIKSDVADIQNAGDASPAPAGAIFGAKFLERFVDYPWAHVDIAGTFWDAKDVPYMPKGATGYGVRLAVEWLRGRARSRP